MCITDIPCSDRLLGGKKFGEGRYLHRKLNLIRCSRSWWLARAFARRLSDVFGCDLFLIFSGRGGTLEKSLIAD